MSEVLSQRDLRNDNARIMRDVEQGKSFIITRNNVPVAELRPLRRERLVEKATIAALFANCPGPDSQTFFEDLAEHFNEDPTPRF